MKLSKKLVTLSLTGGLLLASAPAAFATDTTTDGTINFKESTNLKGDTIKPETDPDEVIIPESGSYTEGLLRIQHVPDFNFGEREIAVGLKTYNPLMKTYKSADPLDTDTYAIPHFIQVTDIRGVNSGWNLDVSASVFKASTGETLPNATITLGQKKLSNNVHGNIADKVNVFKNNATLVIPTAENATEQVLATKDNTIATTTNGTQTSLVLNDTYNAATVYDATKENEGVTFTKTSKDLPVKTVVYKSTITWNLTAGI